MWHGLDIATDQHGTVQTSLCSRKVDCIVQALNRVQTPRSMVFLTTCTVTTCWVFVGHKSTKRHGSEAAGSHKKQGIGQQSAAALGLPLPPYCSSCTGCQYFTSQDCFCFFVCPTTLHDRSGQNTKWRHMHGSVPSS
jgi:hypothetical protein